MAVPAWLTVLAWISLLVALVCAIWVIVDLRRHPQPMKIMNLVWPITMLWAGPIGIWAYQRMGRPHAIMKQQGKSMDDMQMPAWHSTFKGATHCGSGCTLGDIVAETFTLAVPLSLFGHHIFGTWALDFCLAFLFGVAFQYFSIKPMRNLSPGQGLVASLKADTLSLTAWQLGMYGWMALCLFVWFSEQTLPKTSAAFWFMMQIAMLCGLVVAYPVNAWLIRKGIKEAM